MAITQFDLTSGSDATNATVYTTGSIAPTANRIVLVTVLSGVAGNTVVPTVTGASMTWDLVLNSVEETNSRISVFRGVSATPGSGALTITFSLSQNRCLWNVSEFAGTLITGSNGADAIVQSVTSHAISTNPALTLATFSNVGNATFGCVGIVENTTGATAGSGFTQIDNINVESSQSLATEWRNNNSTLVNWTDAGVNAWVAIGIELAASSVVNNSGFLSII